MEKQAAKQLIGETFQNSFDKDRFYRFTKELLNHFEDAHFLYRGNLIPDAYDPYIQTLERLGKYEDPDGNKIDILIVKLKKESSLEHARTMQRNFIGWYLGGSRGDVLKDAALVAFVAPDEENWRFSLVRMEYRVDASGKKLKVKEEFTPTKRYSFIVGKNETTHTAQSRLISILADDERDPTLDHLDEAFNIEKVTREFFEKYSELFFKVKETIDKLVAKDAAIKKDFGAKSVSTVDFSKKLLGQIVFLYFLQKKGWFGVPRGKDWGEGDKQFLRRLFEKAQKENKNYFNKFLEPLFYEALRLERPKDYYDQFDCRIPFLNGGLFDPINDYDWQDTDIVIPNELFSNSIRDPKTGDVGIGILDIFDRYNFTVKEDEPLEKEVAVDPEMLGKVFENLLEVRDRKSKGTYYTPREIVHYMCQESLANYLATELTDKVSKEDIETLIKYGETAVEHDEVYIKKKLQKKVQNGRYSKAKLPKDIEKNAELIDEKLETIRVCDPAVGSGAFPVGMMNEIIRTRNALTPYLGKDGERTPYNFKRHAIQNCLYGVDIDPGAVEICKLRLWLSLVVDEESREVVQPLPNLDYKIMHGNSLIELISFSASDDHKRNEIVGKLKKLKDELFNTTSPNAKKKKRNEIGDLMKRLFEYNRNKQIGELQEKIHSVQSQKRLFEDERDKKGDRLKVQEFEGKIEEIRNIRIPGPTEHFEWHINFSEVFQEKDGFDVVIANPPYIRIFKQGQNDDTKDTLKKLYKSAYKDYDYYVLFLEKGLSILRTDGTLVYITPDKYLVREYGSKIRGIIFTHSIIELFDLSRATDIFEAATYPLISIIQKNSKMGEIKVKIAKTIQNLEHNFKEISISKQQCINKDRIEITDPEFNVLIDKVFKGANRLSEILNPSQIFCGTPRAKDYHLWSKYIGDKQNKNCLRVLVCSNLTPYTINFGKKVRVTGLSISSPYFCNRSGIISETRWKDFSFAPKILIRGNDTRITAVLDEEGSVFIGIYGIKIENNIIQETKTLLACLNSRLYQWIFAIQNPSIKIGGDFFSINSPHILRLPFRKPDQGQRMEFDRLVNKILAITKDSNYLENSTKQAKVRDYEKQIDQFVYKLYGLTPEEIKIVEESSK